MLEFLKTTIVEAGEIALKFYKDGVGHSIKSHLGDFVTKADIAVQDFIIQKIRAAYPDHNVTAEEDHEVINPGAEYEWIIDPIDGTRNFAGGIPFWCVMIGLMKGDDILLGAMYNPITKDLFFAEKEKGAWHGGEKLLVNEISDFDHAFGVVYRDSRFDAPFADEYVRLLSNLNFRVNSWNHNFGSVLINGYLAKGHVDFYATNCGFDHDYVPSVLICREAGALVTDCNGKPWRRGRRDIVISNPKLHPKLLKLFTPS